MTENQLLSRELLSFLGSQPKTLKAEGHKFCGKLAVQLGNAILSLSYSLERGLPQKRQPLDEEATSLWALGQQFREVGLLLWEACETDPAYKELDAKLASVLARLANLEQKQNRKKTRHLRTGNYGGAQ